MWKFSYSFRIMAIFYFINWIVDAETIEGGKLFKGGNYLRKYDKWLKNLPLLLNTLFHTPARAFARKNRTGSFLIHPRKWIYNAISPVGRFRPSSQDIFLQLLFTIFPISIWRFFFLLKVSNCVKKRSQINIRYLLFQILWIWQFKEFTRGK